MGSSDSRQLSDSERAQLAAEVARPFRSLRQLIYGVCIASGGIGAFVFFFRALAGRELETTLPSLALQLGSWREPLPYFAGSVSDRLHWKIDCGSRCDRVISPAHLDRGA